MEIPRVAVERAISSMWEHYGDPLSLDEIADTAILSKFYFSRVFRSVTGTSPGRFLTAIRLYRAKTLLLETSLSVTDIAYHVGYNSLGTFTTRFTRSVGVSPARFRSLASSGMPPLPSSCNSERRQTGIVRGKVMLPAHDTPLRLYVGAFNSPIVEGFPVACDILDSPVDTDQTSGYELDRVPVGTWYLRAAAVAVRDVDPRPWNRRPLFLGTGNPVVVRANSSVEAVVEMHAVDRTDLPILLALPELDSWELPQPVEAAVGA